MQLSGYVTFEWPVDGLCYCDQCLMALYLTESHGALVCLCDYYCIFTHLCVSLHVLSTLQIHDSKLSWKAEPKCGSMDNAHHTAGGGERKV